MLHLWKRQPQTPSVGRCGSFPRVHKESYREEIVAPPVLDNASTRPTTPILLQEWCKTCKTLREAMSIHVHIIETSSECNGVFCGLLVQIYVDCGAVDDAMALFVRLHQRDLVPVNALLKTYARQSKAYCVLELFVQMYQEAIIPSKVSFISGLSVCGSQEDLGEGKRLHARILSHGLRIDAALGTAMMVMYGKCTNVDNARLIFDNMVVRDVVAWTCVISIYVQHDRSKDALQLFELMHRDAIMPNEATIVCVLKACASQRAVFNGSIVHHYVFHNSFDFDDTVGNSLLNFYGICGSLEDAQKTFGAMHKQRVTTWNAMISIYIQHRQGQEALYLFNQMQEARVTPNKVTFLCIFSFFDSNLMLGVAECLHSFIIELDVGLDVSLGNSLVRMYGRCCNVQGSLKVFNCMPKQDVSLWNAALSAYAQSGKGEEALAHFKRMQHEGYIPDKVTFVLILTVCASQGMVTDGVQMHVLIALGWLEVPTILENAIINMYGKCGNLGGAQKVFDRLHIRDAFSWNSMIVAFVRHEKGKQALQLFQQMLQEAVMPAKVSFVCMFSACASHVRLLHEGKRMHIHCLNSRSGSDITTTNALVNMYAKCACFTDAWGIFNEMPERVTSSWNAMIGACLSHGLFSEAFHSFEQMQMEAGLPDKITFLSVLAACSSKAVLGNVKRVHARIAGIEIEAGCDLYNALLTSYGRSGSLESAKQLFDKMKMAGVVSWNSMVGLYAECGRTAEVLQLFNHMQLVGEVANTRTFVSVLLACTSHEALTKALQIHTQVLWSALVTEVIVENALINMYGKCGSLAGAKIIFDHMVVRDVVSWSCMIGVYAQHGWAQEAFDTFTEMQRKEVLPNEVTLLSVLSACNYAGLIHEGRSCFDFIKQSRGAPPIVDHYVSMVDLLGKSGHLDEAEKLIKYMPYAPRVPLYIALLGACRDQADLDRAERASRRVLELDPENTAACLMLSNMCGAFRVC